MYECSSFQNPSRTGGPIQVVHDFQFTALNLKQDMYTFTPEITREERILRVESRIRRLAERGYAGIIITVDHRNYMRDEEALRLITHAVDCAAENGMRVWIYDEQYYPTGAAGGLVLYEHPELEHTGLCCVEKDYEVENVRAAVRLFSPMGHSPLVYAFAQKEGNERFEISRWKDPSGNLCWNAPETGRWHIWAFFTRSLYEGTYKANAMRAPVRYPCTADDRAMARFLDITYGSYERFMGARLGKQVEAVFTDEPSLMNYSPLSRDPEKGPDPLFTMSHYDRPEPEIPDFPFIPWVYNLESTFEKRNGYRLAPFLPDLFSADLEGTRKIRRDFFETLAAMFDNACMEQFRNRLARYPMKLSGHMLAEEDLCNQPYLYGNLLHVLGREDIPGCDLLFSAPERTRHAIALKLASSAAHQYGKEHCMIEASNMCDGDIRFGAQGVNFGDKDYRFGLKDIELAMAMMYALGIDTITSYYGEELFSEDEYRRFTGYTARLSALFRGGVHSSQVLVYYPYEECAELMPAAMCPVSQQAKKLRQSLEYLNEHLLANQVEFDFIAQEVLVRCDFQYGKIITPCGETPETLLFPPVTFVDPPVADSIRKALDNGVRVIIAGERRKIRGLDVEPEFLEECGIPVSDDVRIENEPELVCYHKRFETQNVYLFVNTSRHRIEREIRIPDNGKKLTVLDPDTGTETRIDADVRSGGLRFVTGIPAESAVAIVQE